MTPSFHQFLVSRLSQIEGTITLEQLRAFKREVEAEWIAEGGGVDAFKGTKTIIETADQDQAEDFPNH